MDTLGDPQVGPGIGILGRLSRERRLVPSDAINRPSAIRRCALPQSRPRCASTHAWGNTHPRRANAGCGTQCNSRSRNTSRRDLVHAAIKERRAANTDTAIEPLFRAADELLSQRDFTAIGQFVACFSEAKDDLGQWRGYGGGECGYAIEFSSEGIFCARSADA